MAEDTPGQPAAAAPEPVAPVVATPKETTPVQTIATTTQPPPKETKSATVLEGATDKVEKEVIHDWPDEWREKMAAYTVGKSDGDEYEKELKRLQRHKSPLDVNKSYRQLEGKYKRGEDPDPFPSEGTDEEKTTWRKAHKVPDKPEEYIKDFSLSDGLVIGENDRPYVDEFLKAAHAENRSPDIVKSDLDFYFKMRDRQLQQVGEKDEENKTTAAETLGSEWGQDKEKFFGAAKGLLQDANLLEITAARMKDGTRLGDYLPFIRWAAQTGIDTGTDA